MYQSIRIRILNRDYSLRIPEEDEQITRDMARYVDTKLKEFRQQHPGQHEVTAPVIVALSIAVQLSEEQEKNRRIMEHIEEEFATLADRLAEALPTEVSEDDIPDTPLLIEAFEDGAPVATTPTASPPVRSTPAPSTPTDDATVLPSAISSMPTDAAPPSVDSYDEDGADTTPRSSSFPLFPDDFLPR